jgi:hypothetical protein
VEEQFMAFGQPALPEMRLELVPVPVADVDRARAFSDQAGSELGVDSQQPGSVHGLHLVVNDIEEARQAPRQPGQNVYQAETNTGEDVAVRARAALRPA